LATAWTAAIERRAKATVCLGALAVSLLAFDLPRCLAGSANSQASGNDVSWTPSRRQAAAASTGKLTPGSARLKWGHEASAPPRRLVAEGSPIPVEKAGPALGAPQANRAVYEQADDETGSGDIQLMSLTAPAEDQALDPFQDEVTDEDDEILEDSDVLTDEDSEFDAEEVAQRSTMDESDLSEELRRDLDRMENEMPELGDEYAQAAPGEPERCPSPRDLKPIKQITNRIAAEPGLFPQECALSDYPFQPRNFKGVTFTWKASALCHKPLYFEQPKLERYGHTFGPVLTPIVSMGHFFVSVPLLPYNMGVEPPWECVYPLGWYRPGNCAPYTLGPVPLSLRGAAVQGFVTTGLWFLFP
jgi:hypothetical protein